MMCFFRSFAQLKTIELVVFYSILSSIQLSRLVMSDSLRPHVLQHARPPCPSPTPGIYSNSCPSSRWCHPIVSSSVVPFSSHLQSFPASGSFSSESALCIKWPTYWNFSFNISASDEYSGFWVSEDNYSAPFLPVSSKITDGSSFWIWELSKTPIWSTTLRPVYPSHRSILFSRR